MPRYAMAKHIQLYRNNAIMYRRWPWTRIPTWRRTESSWNGERVSRRWHVLLASTWLSAQHHPIHQQLCY